MVRSVKIFKVQGGDWFAARTLQQALREQVAESGQREFLNNEVRQLTDAEMDRNCVQDEEFGDLEPITFRAALARLVTEGAKVPRLFATTQ